MIGSGLDWTKANGRCDHRTTADVTKGGSLLLKGEGTNDEGFLTDGDSRGVEPAFSAEFRGTSRTRLGLVVYERVKIVPVRGGEDCNSYYVFARMPLA